MDSLPWLSVRETAQKLRIHPQTLYKHIWAKRFPYTRIGGRYRITHQQLEHYLNNRTQGTVKLSIEAPHEETPHGQEDF